MGTVAHRCFAARSDRLSLACLLGLLLAVVALFVLPPLPLANVCGSDDAALSQAQDPPGKHLSVVTCLDLRHVVAPCGDSGLPAPACGFAPLPGGPRKSKG